MAGICLLLAPVETAFPAENDPSHYDGKHNPELAARTARVIRLRDGKLAGG